MEQRQKKKTDPHAEQNRFRSPVLWAAIVAQALAILTMIGVFDEAMSATIKTVVVGVLEMLSLAGVLNNPTDKDGF